MAIAANVIVKKADGTTNITYLVKAAAAGKDPARYREETTSSINALRPVATINVVPSGTSGVVRRLDLNAGYPCTDGVNLTVQVGAVGLRLQLFVPQNVPAAQALEGIHQLLNFASSAEVKHAATDGYAGS